MSASTTARMTIMVEVDCGSPWGDECNIAQVRKQAIESGLATIQRIARESQGNMKIIGTPKITVICSALDEA